jgi:hypothetical protein
VAKKRRTARRWERVVVKVKKRKVERAILGAGMGAAAWMIEKKIIKGLKKKGLDDEFRGRGAEPKPEGFEAAHVTPAKD